MPLQHISEVCTGDAKFASGYVFRFKNDNDDMEAIVNEIRNTKFHERKDQMTLEKVKDILLKV